MSVNINQTISTTFIIEIDELNLNDHQFIKKLIIHIESNILGKIPEISRYLAHYDLIFQLIRQKGDKLGQTCLNDLNVEIEQLFSIFNVNHNKFSNMIKLGDTKQYKSFVKKIGEIKRKVETFTVQLEHLLSNLRLDMVKTIEHSLKPHYTREKTAKYKKTLKLLNSYINDIRAHIDQALNKDDVNNIGSLKNIEWIVKPSNNCCGHKNRKFLCASSVFGLSQNEYKELVENDKLYDVHDPTRKYRCQITEKSAQIFIDKCLLEAFPKMIKNNNTLDIRIFCICPSIKDNTKQLEDKLEEVISHNSANSANSEEHIQNKLTKCNEQIDIIKLIDTLKLSDHYINQLIELKRQLIKKYYGVDILRKCPKPNCPNGNGFFPKETLDDLICGKITQDQMPIHKCLLCNTIWCSKCFKSHPGKLCADIDDENLGSDVKKCPNCFLPCERDGGCFHIACSRCRMHWCWDCNYFTPQSNAYAHKCLKGNWINLDLKATVDETPMEQIPMKQTPIEQMPTEQIPIADSIVDSIDDSIVEANTDVSTFNEWFDV